MRYIGAICKIYVYISIFRLHRTISYFADSVNNVVKFDFFNKSFILYVFFRNRELLFLKKHNLAKLIPTRVLSVF